MVSPRELERWSHCAPDCPECTAVRQHLRRRWLLRVFGYFLVLAAWALIIAAFPVEGLPGAALAVGGMALSLVGWYIAMVRSNRSGDPQ